MGLGGGGFGFKAMKKFSWKNKYVLQTCSAMQTVDDSTANEDALAEHGLALSTKQQITFS